MHAVILAAGDGGRLYPLTGATPKPLVRVAGRPLLHHVLDQLYAAGIREATIVLGHQAETIRGALPDLCPAGMTVRVP